MMIIVLACSPNNAAIIAEASQLVGEIETKCGGKVLCFCQNLRQDDINLTTVSKMRLSLRELGHTDKLVVIMNSGGGDPDAAFHLARLFRRYADKVEIIVTNWAKSAATLICLSADKILMSKDAELGPLDAQLRDPSGSTIPISALNAFKSLEYLQRYAVECLDIATLLFMRKGPMDIPYAIEKALPFVSCIVTPLYEQVDPLELGESRRHLAVAEEYCKRLMRRYGYASTPEIINNTVNQLVWNYPSHSFVIDFEEAQTLKLHVEPLGDDVADLCDTLISKLSSCYGC